MLNGGDGGVRVWISLGLFGQIICPRSQRVSRRINIIGVLAKYCREKGKDVSLRYRSEIIYRRKMLK